MKFLKRVRWAYLLLSIFLIAAGVCMVMWTNITDNMICMMVGGGAMLFGLAKIIIYFVRQVNAVGEQYDFSTGVLCIAAGAVLLVQPQELLRLLPQVLAVYMLCDCVFKVQIALDAKRLGSAAWFLQLFVVLICVGWGVCLLLQPFGLDDYVQMQKAVAEEFGVEWIDAYYGSGIWSDTIDIYTYDKLHLTDEGKQLIGDLIADYLVANPSRPVQ